MTNLREYLKESGISIDELLDTFTIDDISVDNFAKEKLIPDNFKCGSMWMEYYIAKQTISITITIKRTKKNPPEYYKSL